MANAPPIGKVLRVEVAQPRHRRRRDRIEQCWRSVASFGERPRRVGEGLRSELAQPRHRRRRDRVEQLLVLKVTLFFANCLPIPPPNLPVQGHLFFLLED